jgi:hypothetical protein
MADPIDDLIIQLEHFAGIRGLKQTAREILLSAINDIFREKLLEVVRDARRFAEEYQAKAEAEAMKLLIEPERKRRKSGLSNAQKAEYWDSLAQLFRSHMPHDPGSLAEADNRRRQTQPAAQR